MYIRKEWIQKSEFHPYASEEVLLRVIDRVKATVDQKKIPIVVFDLDSTLFDVSARSFEILLEWISHPETENFQDTHLGLRDLKMKDLKYSLEELWDEKKIPTATPPFNHQFKHVKQFWRKRFFSNEYLAKDIPISGAVNYVRLLHELGAHIVYLTGRDVPSMAFGTFDQLKMHGLPIEIERSRLLLKPKRHHDDTEFKTQAAKTISEWGEVVASFENEPKNLVAMSKEFSRETMNIFMETVSSDHPAPVGTSLYRILEFQVQAQAQVKERT